MKNKTHTTKNIFRLLIVMVFGALVGVALANAAVTQPDHYWNFDTIVNGSVYLDSIGSINLLEQYNGDGGTNNYFDWVSGQAGYNGTQDGFYMNKTIAQAGTDYLSNPRNVMITEATSFTISFWINNTEPSNTFDVIMGNDRCGTAVATGGVCIWRKDSDLITEIHSNVVDFWLRTDVNANNFPSDGIYHHYVVRYDQANENLTITIDGIVNQTDTTIGAGSQGAPSHNWLLGADPSNNDATDDNRHTIDDLKIWNGTVLTDDEVYELFTGVPPASDLLAPNVTINDAPSQDEVISVVPILFNATVTDDFGVQNVYLTVNGTSYDMVNDFGNVWTYDYTPGQPGLYSYTITGNDTSANMTTTAAVSFIMDNVSPIVTFVIPTAANTSVLNQSNTLDIQGNNFQLDNATLQVTNASDDLIYEVNVTGIGTGFYQFTTPVNSITTQNGTYMVTACFTDIGGLSTCEAHDFIYAHKITPTTPAPSVSTLQEWVDESSVQFVTFGITIALIMVVGSMIWGLRK